MTSPQLAGLSPSQRHWFARTHCSKSAFFSIVGSLSYWKKLFLYQKTSRNICNELGKEAHATRPTSL